ncbi:TetR family transcriptional regulator C-terminal domain-containing protein [Citrobacter werkmanii]
MMFGELQRAESTPAKRMVQTLIQRYGERLHRLIEKGKASGELSPSLDNEAAATLFIGTIQGLVMQSLLAGDVGRMHRDAPRVFAIYRRGIRCAMKKLPLQGRTPHCLPSSFLCWCFLFMSVCDQGRSPRSL